MLIHHLSDRASRDLELVIARPDATVGDLARALAPGPTAPGRRRPLWIDGRRVVPDTALARAGITNGSTVSREAVPLPGGRPGGATGDPSPTPPPPPTWDPAHLGTTPRNRSGRPAAPAAPAAVALPEAEPAAPTVTPIGVVAMAVSVLGAGVLVVVLGSWTYAAFAVVGPLMMVANTLDSRYRRRRVRRRYARLVRREVVRLEAELGRAADGERLRLAASLPGTAAAVATATAEPPACWERRPDDIDAWSVRVGHGVGPWEPAVDGDLTTAADEVRAVVDAHRRVPATALGFAMRPGAPVAVVGADDAARSLARSLILQLVAFHGPVDLAVAAVVDAAASARWDWLAWLPHVVDRDGRRALAVSGPDADALATRLTGACNDVEPSGGTRAVGLQVVVIDDPAALRARRSAARTLLRHAADADGSTTCIVVLGPDDPVPAACSIVLRVSPDGTLGATAPVAAGAAVAAEVPLETATIAARHLARFDDPELGQDGRMLPDAVRLATLLEIGVDDPTGAAHLERWQAAGDDPPASAVLGMAADGPLGIDLVTDGPHALVAGTTGSGKSEALRSMVVSLAASCSPDHLVFVLIDFKGGSAFDACARLPHTVGLVTDLDDHLAARALRCLEAELRHREERFRTVGAADLGAFRRLDRSGEPLPRLVVVVDEFAALAGALPSFVDALVDVAQRGRSLGVHLVLATQRPGGAVSPAIRANVGLRIALRVQSAEESADVIDSPLAAHLPRHVPGRAIVRLGPGDLVPVQVACASLPRLDAVPPVSVRPLGIERAANGPAGPGPGDDATDLELVVSSLASAWRSSGRPAPRRPWPDPLPVPLDWPLPSTGASGDHIGGHPSRAEDPAGDPPASGCGLTLGVADDPDHQRVVPFRWHVDAGPLLGVGLPGSGTRSLAGTVVLAIAARWTTGSHHVHVLDGSGSDLVALAGLPHVGAVVTAAQIERQRRLVEFLATELAARRAGAAATIRRVLVVHGVTALQGRWEEAGQARSWELLLDLVAGGTAHGIHVCCTAEGASVPHRLVAACEQRVVFRLGDPTDHAAFGVPAREVPPLPAGRGLSPRGLGGPTLVQVATPPDGLAAAVARLAGGHHDDALGAPAWVGVLPERVGPADLPAVPHGRRVGAPVARSTADGGLVLPIGVADQGLTVATLDLGPAGHGIVSGPPRSGRTTALAAVARSATTVDGLRIVVVDPTAGGRIGEAGTDGSRWPAAAEVVGPDDPVLRELAAHDGALLVLVDDADRTADDHPALLALATERRSHRHLVASGRNDRFRARYGHWTRELRADGVGLLLVPDLDLDGDLLGARLPRRPPVALVPGRAWSAGAGVGAGGFVQVVDSTPPSARDTTDSRG